MDVLRQAIVIGCLLVHCVIEQILSFMFFFFDLLRRMETTYGNWVNTLVIVALFMVLQPLL